MAIEGISGAQAPSAPSFGALLRAFVQIGFLSFGGAVGQIAMMHRMLVEERRWLSERQYLNALNYCMLLPGPEAQQLATYVGWLTHGVWGGLAAGLLFVLPGALIMFALSFFFVWGQGIGFVDGIFFGIKAAVVAIVVHAMIKIGKRAVTGPAMLLVALAAFVAIDSARIPFPLVIGVAALAGAVIARNGGTAAGQADEPAIAKHMPGRTLTALTAAAWCLVAWWAPVALAAIALGRDHRLVEIGLYFSKLAVVTFGGAYAVLAYLSQSAVEMGWVSQGEMAAGLGLAETTPGPTILVNQFVAFLAGMRDPSGMDAILAAVLGGAMATWVTFAPSFLWIFAGAPFAEAFNRSAVLAGALRGITAAVVGVIASVALGFALHVLFGSVSRIEAGPLSLPFVDLLSLDPAALGLALIAGLLIFAAHQGVLTTVAVCAALGMALSVWR